MPIPTVDLDLPFSGTVLRPVPFLFNFPIQEGWEFQTDIITADDGTEQRIAVRAPLRPRHHIKANVVCFERDEAQHLEALIFGWQRHTYGVPQWQDAMVLADDAATDDTELVVDDSSGRDLTQRIADEEDVPCLLWRAHDDYEPFLLASEDGTTLTARSAITRDWPKQRTLVVPLQLMLLTEDPDVLRPTRGAAQVALDFTSGQCPTSKNPPCEDGEEDESRSPARALMVRPTWGGSILYLSPSALPHDNNNTGSLHPNFADGAPAWQLFGYTSVTDCGVTYTHASRMAPSGKGKVTGFSLCTLKRPADFDKVIPSIGLGTEVGVDCDLTCFGPFPAGLQPEGAPIVGSVFSGSGYFEPAAGTPTDHLWLAVAVSLMGGCSNVAGVTGRGSRVSSYGLYDVGAPGGIQNYPLEDELSLNADTVELHHGFCVRFAKIAAYKGCKIVTEHFDDPGYGTPEVTSHDFTGDDYTNAEVAGVHGGAFVTCRAGASTILGFAHDGDGAISGTGEVYRVTVYLVDPDDNEHLAWQDDFETMFVEATHS